MNPPASSAKIPAAKAFSTPEPSSACTSPSTPTAPVVVPGDYQVRVTSGSWSQTQPLHIIEAPRVTKGGVTSANLQKQFYHNIRVLTLLNGTNHLVSRLRDADKLLTPPIRYSQPGLQTHVAYLYSMNIGTDQKIGKDAVERYTYLRKQIDQATTELNSIHGTH